jgi:MFS family permease
VEGQSGGGGTSQASRLLRLFRDKRSLLLLLPFAWTGVELAFWTGEFTRLLDEDVIGLVLMWSGVGEIVGSVLVGRLSDRLGRTPLYTIGTAVYGAGLYLAGAVHVRAHWADAPRLESAPWSAYVSAFCFGVGDATFNTQIYAILGQLSHQLGSVELFTVFQLLQNAGSAAGFYVSPYLPLHGDSGTNAQLMLQAGLLASSLISFLAADALVRLAGDEPTEDDSPSDAADAAPMRAADTLSADAETPLR